MQEPIFARDSIYAIARICDRNSGRLDGRLDGRLSVTRVDCTKTVEARIMKLTPQPHDSSFSMANLAAKFEGEHRERGRQIREGYEKYAIFSQ